jgi:hypothetical protein
MMLKWTEKRSSATNTLVAHASTDDLHYKIFREAERKFQGRIYHIGNAMPVAIDDFERTTDAKAWCQKYEDDRAAARSKAAKVAPERAKRQKRGGYKAPRTSRVGANIG